LEKVESWSATPSSRTSGDCSSKEQILCFVVARQGWQQTQIRKAVLLLVNFGGYVFRKLLPIGSLELDKHTCVRNLKYVESLDCVIQKWMEQSYMEYAPSWKVMMVSLLSTTGEEST